MLEKLTIYAVWFLGAALCVSLFYMVRSWRREALFHWASQRRFRIVTYGQPFLAERTRFPASLVKARHIFEIEAVDASGQRRYGSVCLEPYWHGIGFNPEQTHWHETLVVDTTAETVHDCAVVVDADQANL